MPFHFLGLLSQGGSLYIGAGYGSFTGVVLVEFVAIAAVFMLGEYIANDGKEIGRRGRDRLDVISSVRLGSLL